MSDERTIGRCIYPRCDDGSGEQARLTRNVICTGCRRRYWRVLEGLVFDYVTLKSSLPTPTSNSPRQSNTRSYGHPAQWASDKARQIAEKLNELEDDLRERNGDEPAVWPGVDEVHLVRHARDYLGNHFDALCMFDGAQDTAIDLNDLHGKIRSALGQTRFGQRLPTPCPECDAATLVRHVGRIDCASCQTVIREEHYPLLVRIILDNMIDAYDARNKVLV